MQPEKSSPRRARNATGAKVTGQADHRKGTAPLRPARFLPLYPLTAEQVAQALDQADATQLARALDPYAHDRNTRPDGARFYCPSCETFGAYAVDRWRWRCDACPHGGRTGSWLALRAPVAADTEACVRLARLVYGEQVLGGAA
jgi:hypothetical protein